MVPARAELRGAAEAARQRPGRLTIVIRLTRARTLVHGSRDDLARSRRQFEAEGYLKLQGFIEPSLLNVLLDGLDDTAFRNRVHAGIGTHPCGEQGPLSSALQVLINNSPLR